MMNPYFGANRDRTFTQSSPARSTNTNFVISTISDSFVSYSPRLSATGTITLGGGTTGIAQCDLQIRPTPGSGSFTTIATVRLSNATSGAVIIGVSVTDTLTEDLVLAGFVPAGYEVRLNASTTGTASVTMSSQPTQETLYI